MNKKVKLITAILLLAAISLIKNDIRGKENLKIKDMAGREIVIEKEIKKIACLYAFTGHAVTMLGRGSDITAVVRGLKRDILLNEINPAIQKAAVPNQSSILNIEEIAGIKPDIIFLKENIANKKSETSILTRLGIPYVIITFNSIEEQLKSIEIIGKTIGREKEALEYITYYKDCINRVENIIGNIPENKRVRIYHSFLEPLKTGGATGISAEWTKIAGVINVAAHGKNSITDAERFVNIEQVLLWNPQAIIANEDGTADTILNSKQWSSVQAVKDRKVYKLPNGISRWGHPGSIETPLALLWTVKTIYPEYSASIDIEKETRHFYKKFFKYNLSDDTLNKILYEGGMRKPKRGGKL